MPLFSVVIPTYNRSALVRRTLASVAAQSFRDFETIVVDDGSTDDTIEVLKPLESSGTRILQQPNRGPGAARNLGVAHASGDYLIFLDSDDLWFPWTLDVFAQVISRSSPSLIAASLVEFSDESEVERVSQSELRVESFPDYFASAGTGIFVGAGMSVIRRDVFARSKGFTDRPINAEDHDLIMSIGDAPGFVCVRSPVTLAYRRHPGSVRLDPDKMYAGSQFLIEGERTGRYPGGQSRSIQRIEILSQHVRPTILECVRGGRFWRGLSLYTRTFCWHARLGRWRFLLGTPLIAAASPLRLVKRTPQGVSRE
jgi:glycosyltransferase involved in cell wall biosynthesis